MNKFVTAFDAIAGSPFSKKCFFYLFTAFHRTRSKFRLPDTVPLSIPCGYQAVFCINKSKIVFVFVPLIDVISQGLGVYK